MRVRSDEAAWRRYCRSCTDGVLEQDAVFFYSMFSFLSFLSPFLGVEIAHHAPVHAPVAIVVCVDTPGLY